MVLSRYVYINIHIITQWGDSSIQFLKCFVWTSLSVSKPLDKQSQTQQTVYKLPKYIQKLQMFFFTFLSFSYEET